LQSRNVRRRCCQCGRPDSGRSVSATLRAGLRAELGVKSQQTSTQVHGRTGVITPLHSDQPPRRRRGLRLHSLVDPLKQTTMSWLDHEGPRLAAAAPGKERPRRKAVVTRAMRGDVLQQNTKAREDRTWHTNSILTKVGRTARRCFNTRGLTWGPLRLPYTV